MIRTQISLTEDQMQRAKAAAQRQGISLAALIRRALERELTIEEPHHRIAAARELRGRYHSGHTDIAERHDDYLGEHAW